VRSLLDGGWDPLQLWADRTHELGMAFWPSMRMNDIHKDWVDRWPSLRSGWEKEHQHLLIGDHPPQRYVATHGRSFTWAMNYAEEEVRKRKLAIVEEVCANYEVDGFDLDFQSHPYYFRQGEEQRGISLMNGFVERIRGLMGSRALHVRVPPSLAECDEVGLDVLTWIRRGWVDVVTPMTRGYLDMTADLSPFAAAAADTECQIAGGLEHYVREYTGRKTGRSSIEMMRAAAASYWHQGAGGIYLFNFDAHGEVPLSCEERQTLREIGDPVALQGSDKHYFVTRDMEDRTAAEGGDKQLPLQLTQSSPKRRITFTVGDDLDLARRSGDLEGVVLRLSFSADRASLESLSVELNGVRLTPSTTASGRCDYDSAPARQGENELAISLVGVDCCEPHPTRLEGVELLVSYRSAPE